MFAGSKGKLHALSVIHLRETTTPYIHGALVVRAMIPVQHGKFAIKFLMGNFALSVNVDF